MHAGAILSQLKGTFDGLHIHPETVDLKGIQGIHQANDFKDAGYADNMAYT